MENVVLKTKVDGKEIKIKSGLTWGELREIAKVSKVNGKFVPLNALDKLLDIVIVEGINMKDRTALMKLDANEITAMVGEIQGILPLEKYLENLNLDGAIFAGNKESSQQ